MCNYGSCTKNGMIIWKKIFGNDIADSVATLFLTKGHKYVEKHIAATCTKEGVDGTLCIYCGATNPDDWYYTPAKGHKLVEANGYRVCSVCQYSEKIATPDPSPSPDPEPTPDDGDNRK